MKNQFSISRMPGILDSLFSETLAGHEKNHIPVNITEKNDCIEIDLLLPGFSKEKLEINLEEDNVLRIEGKPVEENSDIGIVERRKDFSIRPFKKSFRLGKNLEKKDIRARLHEGILTVLIPKISPDKREKFQNIMVE